LWMSWGLHAVWMRCTPFCLSFSTPLPDSYSLLPVFFYHLCLPAPCLYSQPLACLFSPPCLFFYTLSLSVFFHSLACRFTSHLPVFLHSLAFLFSCPKLSFMPFACPFAPLCLSFHAPLPVYSRPLLACLFPIPCLSFYSPLPVFLRPHSMNF
jgi:hypothetical protein